VLAVGGACTLAELCGFADAVKPCPISDLVRDLMRDGSISDLVRDLMRDVMS
jgi:hypothetical protein